MGQNGHNQKNLQTINAVGGVEIRELSCTTGGKCKLIAANMEDSMEIP